MPVTYIAGRNLHSKQSPVFLVILPVNYPTENLLPAFGGLDFGAAVLELGEVKDVDAEVSFDSSAVPSETGTVA